MILTGTQIVRMVREGRIRVDPFDDRSVEDGGMVGDTSLDLSLSDHLREYVPDAPAWRDSPCAEGFRLHPLDCAKDNPTRELWIPPEGLVLEPGRGYLGCTRESVGSAEFLPWLDGRSSVGRLFMQVHATAGKGNLGFGTLPGTGQWTLEITVTIPLVVYAGMRCCQVFFLSTEGPRDQLYRGKYGGDVRGGPQPSRLWMDFMKWKAGGQ